jgi:ATP-binding cassette subfamily B protein
LPLLLGAILGILATSPLNFDKLGLFLVLFVSANLTHWFFWHAADYVIIKKIVPTFYEYRKACFQNAWNYEYKDYVAKPSSKIAASVNKIYENFDRLYGDLHFGFLPTFTHYTIFIVSMAALVWQNSVLYAIFVISAVFVLIMQLKKVKKSSAQFADKYSEADGATFDSFSNFTNVLSFKAHKKEQNHYKSMVNRLFGFRYRADKDVINFWVAASFMMRWLLWISIAVTNFYLLKSGEINTTQFATSLTVLVAFTGEYWSLVHHIGEFSRNSATYKQYYKYLFGDKDIVKDYYDHKKTSKDKIKPEFRHSLELKNLSFSYPDRVEENVLKNLNLIINKNEKIGIVGQSGGGKSTLVKLLLGFYDFNHDGVMVDGKSINKEELSLLNSYVPQDTSLFQQSIRYNIAYASHDKVSEEEVVQAAKDAHAHDFIMNLKDGYNTLVGERGIKLSLGQRQRIAIARAFLKDSELLILDEATSSLDSKTEADIQQALEKLWQNKTVIAIAHRLSTLNNVDRIIVIDDGKIVEQGTKEQLLLAKGKFAELWKQQKDGLI